LGRGRGAFSPWKNPRAPFAPAHLGSVGLQANTGRPFLPYSAAKAWLRKALISVAAGDPAPAIMTRVFGK
jgi:hypothetical protein